MINLIASSACNTPMIPGSTPSTPASAQLGTDPGDGRFRKKTAVTWSVEVRRENGGLAIEAKNRAVDVWFARPNANIVRQITRRKIIRPIHHDVVIAHDRHRVLAAKSVFVQNHFNMRIGVAQAVARRFQLWSADIFCSMQNLALQIRKIDFIVINQTECSYTSRGQIKRGRGTEPARTDAQNTRRFQTGAARRS